MTPEQMQAALKKLFAETEAELSLGDVKVKRLHKALSNLLKAKLEDLKDQNVLIEQFAESGGSEKLKAILGLGEFDLEILESVFRQRACIQFSLIEKYRHCVRANTVAMPAPLQNSVSTSDVSYDLIYQAAKKGDEQQIRVWAKEGVYLDPIKWINVSGQQQANRLMLITPAGQLAREGVHASVALLHVFGASPFYIVRGYASAADHHSCSEWLEYDPIQARGYGYFYSTTPSIPRGNCREEEYQLLLASIYVRDGLHDQVEECRKKGANAEIIAQYYVLAGLDAKVDEYYALDNGLASGIAQRYAKQGNHDRVAAYVKKGAAIEWIIEAYAEVNNHNLVEAYRVYYDISFQRIASSYCKKKQFQKVMELQKNHDLSFAPLIRICNITGDYYFASRFQLQANTAGVENIISQDELDNIGFDEIYQAAKRGDSSRLLEWRQAQVCLDPLKIITREVQIANKPAMQLKLSSTPAGKLAGEGDDVAVDLLIRYGRVDVYYIAEAYAAALNYEKCEKWGNYIDAINRGYIIAGDYERAASYLKDKKNLNYIVRIHATNGSHAEVAACHRMGASAAFIVNGYYTGGYFIESEPYEKEIIDRKNLIENKIGGLVAAGNYKKVAEYSQDFEVILYYLAYFNRHGYVKQYQAQFGCVDVIAKGYARRKNLSKVQQCLFGQGASLESIAQGFSVVGKKSLAILYKLAASAAKKGAAASNVVVAPTPNIAATEDALAEAQREIVRLNQLIALQKETLTRVATTQFFLSSNSTSVAPPPQAVEGSNDAKRKARDEDEGDRPGKKR